SMMRSVRGFSPVVSRSRNASGRSRANGNCINELPGFGRAIDRLPLNPSYTLREEEEMAGGAMRVVKIAQPGGPEVLQLDERPRPEPGPGQLVVKVRSSGLNRADLLQRRGHYPAPPGW